MKSRSTPPAVHFVFNGDLPRFLRRHNKDLRRLVYPLDRRASIKDAVEALGVPHTEIAELVVNGQAVSFSYILDPDDKVHVLPVRHPFDVSSPTLLRPDPIQDVRFVVDTNVGKLARLLRMAGFDTLYHPEWHDSDLAERADLEKRILLTRDTRLLQRSNVVFGRFVRALDPTEQLAEIITLYGLRHSIAPFTRCLLCNGILEDVEKNAVIERLEPLTKKYYNTFRRCPDCDRIYWPGSHRERMERILAALPGQTDR